MEENKQFPRPEEEQATEPVPPVPEEAGLDVTPDMEEEIPVFTELTMHALEEEPAPEELPLPDETAPAAEMPAVEEAAPAEEAPIAEEVVPAEDTPVMEEAALAEETPIAEEAAPAEEIPVVVETVPAEDTPAAEEAAPAEESPVIEETAPAEESPVEEEIETAPAQEETPVRDGADFMSRIPNVDEDYPEDKELAQTIEELEALLDKPVDQDYQDAEPDPEFDAMLNAPTPEAPKEEHARPTHKGRPKRKKGEGLFGIPNILATFVWLVLILVIGVTAGRMLWVCAADVLAFGRQDKAVTITIYEADTMEDIVDKLHANGLIRYKSLFNLYASISDAEEDIQPGIYDLNTRYDYHALVNFMSPKSSREVVELTIPEGYTCQQIFALLEENRVCTALDAASYAATGELNDYWFLEGVERGTENCLEGYLFPDTYEFYKNSTPREALQRMLNNFEIKFTEDMRAQLDALNAKYNAGYTVREITIVASLIEKESAAPGESPMISGVIYNRLFNWGDNPKLLGIDAAIVYAQGDAEHIDTSIDHPYNTYRNPGLTPGPISNPGLASLKAALNPESHNYYYYVLNPSTGMHQFSTTNEEHNAWIAQFYD